MPRSVSLRGGPCGPVPEGTRDVDLGRTLDTDWLLCKLQRLSGMKASYVVRYRTWLAGTLEVVWEKQGGANEET